jgi:hypothetical protein
MTHQNGCVYRTATSPGSELSILFVMINELLSFEL